MRHWVVGNIYGQTLKLGQMMQYAEQFSPFHGPSPPSGAHRYGFFIFEQTSKLPDPMFGDNITKWDYERYLTEANVGAPVASNWILVQHGE